MKGLTGMTKVENLVGQQFSRLTVLERAGSDKRGSALWKCQCTCGRITTALTYQLKSGAKKSCGCLSKEKATKRLLKHSESNTRLYKVWKGIKRRCYNANDSQYKNYGGRGIKMCQEWKDNYIAFRDFMLSKGYDETLPFRAQTIERIDVNGDYEPCNCKLVTMKEQNINKRCNHKVTYKGVTKTLTEFADELGLDAENLYNRINNYGYSVEEAIEKPVRKCSHKNAPKYTVDNKTLTLSEWALYLGLTRSQLKSKTRRKPLEEVVRELLYN